MNMSVKVYFESKGSADHVATFNNENTYDLCRIALGGEARKHRMKLTENIEEGKGMPLSEDAIAELRSYIVDSGYEDSLLMQLNDKKNREELAKWLGLED
jgi:hypothetical protein